MGVAGIGATSVLVFSAGSPVFSVDFSFTAGAFTAGAFTAGAFGSATGAVGAVASAVPGIVEVFGAEAG